MCDCDSDYITVNTKRHINEQLQNTAIIGVEQQLGGVAKLKCSERLRTRYF